MHPVHLAGSQLSREGLKRLLTGSDFSVVSEARTLDEVPLLLSLEYDIERRPKILLLYSEVRLSDAEEQMLLKIKIENPALLVCVIGNPASLGLLAHSCPTDIDGYLLNEISASGLLHALALISSGQRIFPPSGPAEPQVAIPCIVAVDGPKTTTGLSAREAQILELLVVGSSNKAIARDLAISHETVKVHMKALLRKLNARNRTQAALWGLKNGGTQVAPPLQEELPLPEPPGMQISHLQLAGRFLASALLPILEGLSLDYDAIAGIIV